MTQVAQAGHVARGLIRGIAAALCLSLLAVSSVGAEGRERGAVYVESQGLCYRTFVTTDLPDQGPFQLIEPDPLARCGAGSSKTQYGPGDAGYLGGRWKTPDGQTFSCPLQGPGYPPA